MTDASRRDFLILTGAAGAGLLLAESSPRALAATNSAVNLDPTTGRTKVAAMLADAPTSGGYEIVPLVSAGDNIPLLTGTWPDLQPHPELTYGITSDPDGMGLMTVGEHHYVWLQHELVGDKGDEDFNETKFSDTISGMVPGARLSLLKFTKDWQVIGGTQLIREFKQTAWLQNDDGAHAPPPRNSLSTSISARSPSLAMYRRTIAAAP